MTWQKDIISGPFGQSDLGNVYNLIVVNARDTDYYYYSYGLSEECSAQEMSALEWAGK